MRTIRKSIHEKEYTKTDLARRRCVQGVWFEEDYVRDYPLKTLASNVIGVGSNSGGASGLESYYTDVLDGTDGREFGYLDENSDLQRTIVEPTNGNTIVSTLDINIQQVVEKYIAEFDAEYGKDAEDGKGAKNNWCHRRKSAERRDLCDGEQPRI